MRNWILLELGQIMEILISCIFIFIGVIIITRIAGLRTFAKMSSIDFASTIAIGSVIAAVIMNEDQSIMKGVAAIAFIIIFQFSSSYLQRKYLWFRKLVTNKPVELLRKGKISKHNLKLTGVSENDLMAKLREANALNLNNVLSVVLETTGDISVIHSSDTDEVSDQIMKGVDRM